MSAGIATRRAEPDAKGGFGDPKGRVGEILPPGQGSVRVVAAAHPLKAERVDITVPAGLTLAEIIATAQPDPVLQSGFHVFVGEHYVPRAHWTRVRPKPGTMVSVRAFVAPMGGGPGGGKNILRSILLIAVAGAALFFGPALGAALGFSGSLAASVGQAIIGLGGMLLVNALVPPALAGPGGERESQTQFIENARNRANPFGAIPVVFGRHRVVPTLAADPVTEVVGDDQYLRMIFCWGIGPVSIEDVRIGQTPIGEFSDVEIEHRNGYTDDDPITLYSAVTDQQNLSILLSQAEGWIVRTSADNVDQLSVDWTWFSGLVRIDDNGNRQKKQVMVQVQFAEAGTGNWQPIPTARTKRTFRRGWVNEDDFGGTHFERIGFIDKRTAAIRHGMTWRTPERGRYDVRMRRITADDDDDRVYTDVHWTALRSIRNENPIQSHIPVALTAIEIRATDQLNGVIDDLNGLVTMRTRDWTGFTWNPVRESTNPATAFRHALQGPAVQSPYPDTAIDFDGLADWHEYCTLMGFSYNRVHDFTQSLWDTLVDIARAGRASPTWRDGKWGVVIDRPKLPVSHVTPRNSWGFTASKAFADSPHGFRVRFNNQDADYRNDELVVYIDGHSAATASKFESMTFPGATDPAAIAKHARFNAAVAVHRPERWNFFQDMERMVYGRGDLVLVTHDVLLVGLAYGRLKSVTLDGSGNAIEAELDELVAMEAGKSYGLSIRTPDDVALTAAIVTEPGETRSIIFASPIPAAQAPAAGDMFGFGEVGKETDTGLVIAVESGDNLSAEITAVPYREVIYDIDAGPIPPFETHLTPVEAVPDVQVVSIRSDESVLTAGPGDSLNCQIAVKVASPHSNLDLSLQVQVRPSDVDQAPFGAAQINAMSDNEMFIGDVRTNEYVDLRLRWVAQGRVTPGRWTYVTGHRVVGKSTPPAALRNVSLQSFGSQAFLRWDQPSELDVIFGGQVRFRHSGDVNPTWNTSVSIGNVTHARALVASLPLKPGTYLARVFDVTGLRSDVVSVHTTQATVLNFANVASLDEAPGFVGTHDGTVSVDGILKLAASGLFDDIEDFDEVQNLDNLGGSIAAGTYDFGLGFDFGAVSRRRLTTRLSAVIFDETDVIESWIDELDNREDFDGIDWATADCDVQVSLTDDDPEGEPSWGPWTRLDSHEVVARACRFRAVLTTASPDVNIQISELGIDADEVTL